MRWAHMRWAHALGTCAGPCADLSAVWAEHTHTHAGARFHLYDEYSFDACAPWRRLSAVVFPCVGVWGGTQCRTDFWPRVGGQDLQTHFFRRYSDDIQTITYVLP